MIQDKLYFYYLYNFNHIIHHVAKVSIEQI